MQLYNIQLSESNLDLFLSYLYNFGLDELYADIFQQKLYEQPNHQVE